MNTVPFRVEGTCGRARAGLLDLARGTVRTPVFMPVGTQGAVRALPASLLAGTGAQIVLANTYHLAQRPGERVVERHGGLHAFMGVELPILTDSGGFQVFSLDKKRVTDEGVEFAYEVDGRRTVLTPERSMEIQQALGSDIAMAFDECLPHGADRERTRLGVERTTRWAERCRAAHVRPDQSLFGIVQGGFFDDLRRRSVREIVGIGFDGYAIGGVSVGESPEEMVRVVEVTAPLLPEDRPRYLMGVGRPVDLVEAVARGVDMFDCVIPTRHARSAVLYTFAGRIRLTDRRYRNDLYPPDTSCDCWTCRTHTRAYLHHLFRVGEVLAATLATLHNIRFFQRFMAEMRAAILNGRLDAFRRRVHEVHGPRPAPAPRRRRRRGG